jgi:hypothetical protein
VSPAYYFTSNQHVTDDGMVIPNERDLAHRSLVHPFGFSQYMPQLSDTMGEDADLKQQHS